MLVDSDELRLLVGTAARSGATLVRLTAAGDSLSSEATSIDGHRFSASCPAVGDDEWTDAVQVADLAMVLKAAEGEVELETDGARVLLTGHGVKAKLSAANTPAINIDETGMEPVPAEVVEALARAAKTSDMRRLGVANGAVNALHAESTGIIIGLPAPCRPLSILPLTAASMAGLHASAARASNGRLVATGMIDRVTWRCSLPLGTDQVPDARATLTKAFEPEWSMTVVRKEMAKAASWVNGLIDRKADVRHCTAMPDPEGGVVTLLASRQGGDEFSLDVEASFDGQPSVLKIVVPNIAMLLGDQDDEVKFTVLHRAGKSAVLTTTAGETMRWAMLVNTA